VELDAPERPLAVLDRNQHAVGSPGDAAQLVRQRLLDAERVVAHGLELARDAGEERRVVVEDSAEAAVHGLGRGHDRRAAEHSQALVAEADTQKRPLATADRLGADTEVLLLPGPAGAGREDDVVEVQPRQLVPARLVVADDERLLAAHLAEQLEEVVGEGVVVVDQQCCHNGPVAHPRRPDPEQGVFETLLVLDGRPVELEAHLERLGASLEELFPDQTGSDLREEIERHAVETDRGALRVAVAPRGDAGLGAEFSIRKGHVDFVSLSEANPPQPISLRGFSLGGGLGAHKWADRSLLDEVQARLPTGTLPLIVDADGAVLEASRANLFAVRDGALFTPPLDSRILPGVTRARVLDLAGAAGLEAHETTLRRDDLLAADEVFLTGSVRGIEPVASLDGAALAGPCPITGELAAGLRRAWLGAPVA
jgi:branched-subunit amino acid aminotransferase/4-amino-4-deoxychorismate lyase